MTAAVSVAGDPEALVAIGAGLAAAAALVAREPRRRAVAMLAALGLAAVALAVLVGDDLGDQIGRRPALAAAAAAAALLVVAGLAALVHRRPDALPLLVVAVLPFRVPLPVGDDTANLLLPLYAVIGAGVLALAAAALGSGSVAARQRDAVARPEAADRRVRHVRLALGAVIAAYAVQTLYSTDPEQAVKNLCFFYVPFAVLFLLLLEVRWSRRVLLAAFGIAVGLALVFAAIGFVEFATGRLLISNEKVLEANELKPYFRVNSLFFDPNIYGRYLALTMVGLAAGLLWSRRDREVAAAAIALAILWAGMVLSLSQSSFAALVVGLAVLAGLRWRAGPVVLAIAAAVAVSAAVVALAGGAIGVDIGSERALDRATSGRVDLVTGAAGMVADRPVWGFGSGSFAERFRVREDVQSERAAAASHTTPLTVTAEQGVIGLLLYLALLATALVMLFGGVRAGLRSDRATVGWVTRAAVAAAFCGLVLHTLVYAAFLEDPLAWLLLAIAGALRRPAAGDDDGSVTESRGAVPTMAACSLAPAGRG